ncbi:hypothetical protein BKA70DRAFT_1524694 [Coprinopsis sp. MPI-PUGE-AT-0042]|nr:hypothetical protein BKA70DRAFT_1524694 [Coprinopsis sp. MPI-PUGE-AT-0042]
MEPSTFVLPGIKKKPTTTHDELRQSDEYVRTIYSPPVRGSRRRKAVRASSHATPSGDAVQKNYAIRWLTSVLSYLRETERLLADTAALLAICAGTASAGVTPCPMSSEGKEAGMISIHLRDVPLDNQGYGCVGAQTWGWACVMAEMVVEDPTRRTGRKEETKQRSFRILERGAGTGLVSLAVASFYHALFSRDPHTSQPGCSKGNVEITAIDYYSSVLEKHEVNLQNNGFGSAPEGTNVVTSTSNQLTSTTPNVSLKSCSLDWSTFPSLSSSSSPLSPPPSSPNDTPLDELFDMAFGADIVYEEQPAVRIKGCLKKLLRRPLWTTSTAGGDESEDKDPNSYFHLMIPLRSTHTFESGTIETVFRSVLHWQVMDGALGEVGNAEMDLVILEKETITCEVEEGG